MEVGLLGSSPGKILELGLNPHSRREQRGVNLGGNTSVSPALFKTDPRTEGSDFTTSKRQPLGAKGREAFRVGLEGKETDQYRKQNVRD